MQFVWIFSIVFLPGSFGGNSARRLFDDLLTNYNRMVRPVRNHSQTLQVRLNLKLSQLLDVHEKDQIMTTNVWLHQQWHDHKMTWNPDDYEGIETIYVPANLLWRPDLVLYNTADGNYEVKIMTKAMVRHDGLVTWEPPAVFRSVCEMNVTWFPLDEQKCKMKIGSWAYDGFMVDLIHYEDISEVTELVNEQNQRVWLVENAIDLSSYYQSVEWDIMAVPGERHFLFYPCCEAPFVDITYYIHLRRKTLFYTVNLIIPCVGISFLTMFVFYLPANSGEKIVMCISILISLNVFLLLLIELIPSTSLSMPLIARYLLFTMILVTLSVAMTVMTLSINYRAPSTHAMPRWVRRWFLRRLPKCMGIKPMKSYCLDEDENSNKSELRTRRKNWSSDIKVKRNTVESTTYGTGFVVANNHAATCQARGAMNFQLPTIVINEATESGERERIISNERQPNDSLLNTEELGDIGDGADRNLEAADELSDAKSGEFLEARLVREVWERRPSLVPILAMREESKRGVEEGDPNSATKYVASCVSLIAHKISRDAQEKEIQQEWSYVALVIDRFFLYLFSIACVIGTCCIILQAPSLYDSRRPLP